MIQILSAVVKVLGIDEDPDPLLFVLYNGHCVSSLELRLFKIELLYEAVVPLRVLLLKVFHLRLAVCHKLEKPSSGVIILEVLLKMLGKFVNSLTDKGNLHLR